MTVNRNYVWASGALAAVLLVFYWWGLQGDALSPSPPIDPQAEASVSSEEHHLPRRHSHQDRSRSHREECAACPDVESMKRLGPEESGTIRHFDECEEILKEAAAAGNPYPDTSSLEGCGGLTSLHFATTLEQVQDLLAAGANPSAIDHLGRTPLSLIVMTGTMMGVPSGEGEQYLEMTKLLLEAGADSFLRSPDELETVTRHLNYALAANASTHLAHQGRVENLADHMGVSSEEIPDEISVPLRQRERLIQERYLHAAKTRDLLFEAWSQGNSQ